MIKLRILIRLCEMFLEICCLSFLQFFIVIAYFRLLALSVELWITPIIFDSIGQSKDFTNGKPKNRLTYEELFELNLNFPATRLMSPFKIAVALNLQVFLLKA